MFMGVFLFLPPFFLCCKSGMVPYLFIVTCEVVKSSMFGGEVGFYAWVRYGISIRCVRVVYCVLW